MDDELKVNNTSKIARIFNVIMLIFNFLMALGVTAIKFASESYVSISNQLFPPDGPLMDSVILDILLRKSAVVLIVVFLAVLVFKEIKVKPIRTRLYINIAAFAAIAGYASLLIYLIYSPVVRKEGCNGI